MRPSATQIRAVYQRLLAHEPDAPNDFIELLLEPLVDAFSARFPDVSHPDLVTDTVIDSLLQFVQSPEKYQPERGSIWNYLFMDIQGDWLNSVAKEDRRRKREIAFDLVAHDLPDGNIDVEEEVLQRLEASSGVDAVNSQNILTQLRQEIPDPRDWQVLLLLFSGERSTRVFAAILDIEHLSIEEQRQYVKRTKDRLRLRLKRYGVKIHEH